MVLSTAEAASSSTSTDSIRPWNYHVFLSFRGKDTRRGFIDHLYAALQRRAIITFRDDYEREREEAISQAFVNAIEESLSMIVVISRKYASSTWCLDELQKILESRRDVFPIFYGIDPSDARYQIGSFAEAFKKHEERYKEDREKVQRWRNALREVANLSGWDCSNRNEAELIEDIIELIWTRLSPKFPSYNDKLVGIDSRIGKIDLFPSIGSQDVQFIGIWGMGGIGKTTLARVLFERIRGQFEVDCFLANVRKVSERDDLVLLQKELLSNPKLGSIDIDNIYDGRKTIRNLLRHKKVLIVLDNVSNQSHLENLAGNKQWFGPGSIIIVTTRDMHLLELHGIYRRYEIQPLNIQESLQLFCQKAFKNNQPLEGYLELSIAAIQYAGGLPLALVVLGSFLCGRSASEWEDALDKIKQLPHNDILGTLGISYDGLEDTEKIIFLDIACFFNGMVKSEVTKLLKFCGLNATIGITVLVEKSLVSDEHGVLRIHDLLQKMGKNIVFKESQHNPGNRSRLWSQKDIDQVLKMNKGSESIQAIVLEPQEPYEAHWDPKAFTNMCNLRLLKISNVHLPHGLEYLPNSIKVLEWEGCSLKALPLGVQDELVDLRMLRSKMIKPWNGTRFFGKLKSIDLSHSKDLTQTPIISGIPHLERLILEGCKRLIKLHHSIGQHNKLVELNLKDCINLKTFPGKIEMSSLKNFILSGCSKILKLPDFGENMESLSVLDLKDCINVVCLPNTIRYLKSLKTLNISGCAKLSQLPNNMDENEALEELNVSGTAIRDFMSSNTTKLTLSPRWKFMRPSIPIGTMHTPILRLSFLKELSLASCNLIDGSIPDDLSCLSSLQRIDLSGNDFVNLPVYCIANLSKLCSLDLDSCTRLEMLPVLPQYLENLDARDCASLQPIYDRLQLRNLFPLDEQEIKPSARRALFITGSAIPPWFDNENFAFCDAEAAHLNFDVDSIISLVVDIPQYCRESEWWRVDVCLVLEYVESSTLISRDPSDSFVSFVYIMGKATEPDSPLYYDFVIRKFVTLDRPHLWITSLRTLHEHLRGDSNRLQLFFFTRTYPKFGKMKITQGGCHVYCKEEAESWHRARNYLENTIPSNSEYSSSLRVSLPTPAVSTGQEVEQLPMKSDTLNNSKEYILPAQMQEPNPNKDRSNKMCAKPSPSMSETSGSRFRFRNKRCICEQIAALRVSESEELYYVCEDNKCNYFEWWNPNSSSDKNRCCENVGHKLQLPQLKILVLANLIWSIFIVVCLLHAFIWKVD